MKMRSPGSPNRIKRAMSAAEALELFIKSRNGEAQAGLTALWEHWDMVMGPDLSALIMPLGHKDGELLLGAEDSAAAQEAHLCAYEILERANAFMDREFFSKVRVSLMQGRNSLACPPPRLTIEPLPTMPPRPPRLGSLNLDPTDPVGRAYAAYVRAFE